ncbi:hypothetical protein N9P88_02545 [Planctomycetota bacterium]|nr:hypothetical protein [Planctomycetota bacterium]
MIQKPPLCMSWIIAVFCALFCIVFGSLPILGNDALSESSVGIEGQFDYPWQGDTLEIAPLSENSAVIVRIANITEDGEVTTYDIRWLALLPGDHDLSIFFRHGENRPAKLAPMRVFADSLLGSNHEGSLTRIPGTLSPIIDFPAWVLWAIVVFWLLLPLAVIGILRWLKPPPPVLIVEPPLSIADKLRPYVDAALSGDLDTEGKAALERLLLAFWRDDLQLGSFRHAEALQAMRKHEVAGELILTVERWLHSGKETNADTDQVDQLLQPYKSMPIDEAAPE